MPRPPALAAGVLPGLAAALAALAAPRAAHAGPVARCAAAPTADLAIDGLLDDWAGPVPVRAGEPPDGAVAVRCAWDGAALALAIEVQDDRVVRVRGTGADDRVTVRLAAGGAPVVVQAAPGTAIAPSRLARPARVEAADSLQPRGFSLEVRLPAAAVAGLEGSAPALTLALVFHDSDRATGGDTTAIALDASLELPDRADLLGDLLAAVKLDRRALKVDTLAELDPDRRGAERLVAGGTVIAVLTERFAYVTLPVARATDVLDVRLLPLGPRGLQVIAATVRQVGNGGSRDLLMLWTVWGGQLHPLGQIEVRKQLGDGVLEVAHAIVRGARGPELRVTPLPARGLTAETWPEAPAPDADPILLPWDPTRGGTAYTLVGAELARRPLPAPRRR